MLHSLDNAPTRLYVPPPVFVTAAFGFPLPPAAHLLVHSLVVGFLMRRTPAGAAVGSIAKDASQGPVPVTCPTAAPALPCHPGLASNVRLPAGRPPTPAACAQYVGGDGSNALVVRALYGVMQQLASLLCLGSRPALAAAADASTDQQQCTAVVWALEVRWVGEAWAHAAFLPACMDAPACSLCTHPHAGVGPLLCRRLWGMCCQRS